MTKGIKNEIEYRLGLYFSLKSGVLYVRDKKYGDEEQVMKQLEDDITKDVIFLSRKQLGGDSRGKRFQKYMRVVSN